MEQERRSRTQVYATLSSAQRDGWHGPHNMISTTKNHREFTNTAVTLYSRALCGGLNEVLDDYHDIVVQVILIDTHVRTSNRNTCTHCSTRNHNVLQEEQTFLKDADTPVSHIYHKIRGVRPVHQACCHTWECKKKKSCLPPRACCCSTNSCSRSCRRRWRKLTRGL